MLQKMLDEAMKVADWMRDLAYVFEKEGGGFAVVDCETAGKLRGVSEYKFRAIVHPKP